MNAKVAVGKTLHGFLALTLGFGLIAGGIDPAVAQGARVQADELGG